MTTTIAYVFCRKCTELKPKSEYYTFSPRTRRGVCKVCFNKNQAELNRQRVEDDPRYLKDRNLLRRYGLTAEQFDELLIKQDGKCAICQQETTKLNVDHDHETGVIRGLLCNPCNTGLGHLEKGGWLEKAHAYLEVHAEGKP